MYQFQIETYRRQKKEINRMGHWQGLQTKSGQERNFYVEDGKFYDSIKKRHEYRDCEPYDLIKDNTVKTITKDFKIPVKESDLLIEPKATIKQEIKQENANRYKALSTAQGSIAKTLLNDSKLNHTSFTKALTSGTANPAEKRKTRSIYDAIIKELLDNDIATKKGLNYIYK